MSDPELDQVVRDVFDANRYLTLGTVEPDGGPRLSPVYFTHHEYRTLYWISHPRAQHSQNVETTPEIVMVIFDSSVPPTDNPQAVYLSATAQRVPDDQLAIECVIAFRDVGADAHPFAPEELTAPAPLRLYRAVVSGYEIHIRGNHPTLGTGTDVRLPVTLAEE
ncbi:pyridoxamine 5'-phosphate oxidase family protein [Paractinoplanes rishiriensis]|uniref:Pyridoxamine 5'-phosphate oxidase N-terminal domain-containing protein n=1 Tax=Paractinoplanes rishiriensis TaxID=1050105 RepID=A0A919K5T3_9ACTN|nr:pyridoxamine 5'-phosphate oxidase family protein [Actinoplanes rishiriensis]GIE99259.1 hypothetical protein Ari01nite_67240 [Actinoplanes rishiriensis]